MLPWNFFGKFVNSGSKATRDFPRPKKIQLAHVFRLHSISSKIERITGKAAIVVLLLLLAQGVVSSLEFCAGLWIGWRLFRYTGSPFEKQLGLTKKKKQQRLTSSFPMCFG